MSLLHKFLLIRGISSSLRKLRQRCILQRLSSSEWTVYSFAYVWVIIHEISCIVLLAFYYIIVSYIMSLDSACMKRPLEGAKVIATLSLS